VGLTSVPANPAIVSPIKRRRVNVKSLLLLHGKHYACYTVFRCNRGASVQFVGLSLVLC